MIPENDMTDTVDPWRTPGSPGIAGMLEQWDAMSEHYLPGRALLFDALIGELSDRLDARGATVLELGSGPGTLLRRLAGAMPGAHLIGIEIDPVLRVVHELAATGRGAAAAEIVAADLCDAGWSDLLPMGAALDAVVAVQVLHYFPEPRFTALLAEIRALLAPGGVLVHLDHVPPGVPPAHAPAAADPADAPGWPQPPDDPWTRWWAEARSMPELGDAFHQRERAAAATGTSGSAEYHPDERSLRTMLTHAGFDTIEQRRHGAQALLTFARTAS